MSPWRKACKHAAVAAVALILAAAHAAAGEREDFEQLVTAFKSRDFHAVRRLARSLSDLPAYRFQTMLILADISFQEGDLIYAEQQFEGLLREFPARRAVIEQRLDRVRREKTFAATGGRDQGRHVSVVWGGGTESASLIERVHRIGEEAYDETTRFFGHYPENQVQLLVYSGDEYQTYTTLPPWSGGAFDGKIRLLLSPTMPDGRIKEVIAHEYAHVIVLEMTRGRCPLWLNEAIAQYVSLTQARPDMLARMPAPSLRPDDFPPAWLSLPKEAVERYYRESLSLLIAIVKRTGVHVIRDILADLGTGSEFAKAFASAVAMYGYTPQTLLDDVLVTK